MIEVERWRPLVGTRCESFAGFAAAESAILRSEGDLFSAESKGDEVLCRTGRWAGVEELFKTDTAVPSESFQATIPAVAAPGFSHIWCDYFVGPEGLGPMLRFLDKALPRAGLDRVQILAVKRPPLPGRRAFVPLPRFDSGRYFGIGVFYSVPSADAETVERARAAQSALLELCLRNGGRPYLCGAHDIDEDGIESIYGDEFREVQRIRGPLDPDGLFNPPPASTFQREEAERLPENRRTADDRQ